MHIDPMALAIIEGVLTCVVGAGVLAVARMLSGFAKRQRVSDELMRESLRSMQRAELLRMFQRVVEDGKPVTVEELEHDEACYKAYHDIGGNDVGSWLYQQIKDHAFVVTKAVKIGGTE